MFSIMADHKKKEELQSINIKINQFLNTFIVHSLTALACLLLCSYPSLFSSMQHLSSIFLPRICSLLSNPKFLFIVVNLIVAFLVKESNLLDPPTSPPSNDIYDEYLKRSQISRRVSSRHVQKKRHEKRKKIETTRVIDFEKHSIDKYCDGGEIQRVESKADDSEVKAIEEPKVKVHCSVKSCKREKGDEEEEAGFAADELNKRVDAFIARVNKQRWLEARWSVCSKA